MIYAVLKVLISAIIIVAASELAKRDGWLAALLISLPTVSLLAIVWLYVESHDVEKIATLSTGIFWLVLPSLAFFAVLPWMLKAKISFWPSLAVSLALMFACYLIMTMLLKKLGVQP
ncbi:MAG: DUF3147 family protein [Methylophilaceae bacterium]